VYVCIMYVRVYVCMYVCMYVCVCVFLYVVYCFSHYSGNTTRFAIILVDVYTIFTII